MKFVIYGAGAIGCLLGARLSLAGEEVVLIARGPHLAAIQAHGIRIQSSEGEINANPKAVDGPETVGTADIVILTAKAHSLTAIAPKLSPLIGFDTVIVSAQNGIPWWYFQSHGGPWEGTHLESVDPGQIIGSAIEPDRIIGCIVYPSAHIIQPGVIEHLEGNRFSIGELNGATTDRLKRLSTSLIKAGLRAPIRPNIRQDLWVKLLGNVAFNPLSAITRATLLEIATDPDCRNIAELVMREVDSVASGLGVELPISVEQRLKGAENVGNHKTSMLQDIEMGRPLELESLVGAVLELGELLKIPMPYTRTLYASTKLLAASLGT